MPPARFEFAVPASEWPQTLAIDRSATGIGSVKINTLDCVIAPVCNVISH